MGSNAYATFRPTNPEAAENWKFLETKFKIEFSTFCDKQEFGKTVRCEDCFEAKRSNGHFNHKRLIFPGNANYCEPADAKCHHCNAAWNKRRVVLPHWRVIVPNWVVGAVDYITKKKNAEDATTAWGSDTLCMDPDHWECSNCTPADEWDCRICTSP